MQIRILYILISLIAISSCVGNESKVVKSNKDEQKEYEAFNKIVCAELSPDSILNDWNKYQCDLFKLFGEPCYSNFDSSYNMKVLRLFERNTLTTNYIYSYEEFDGCTAQKIKAIPPNQFNLFTYLTGNQKISYTTDFSVTKSDNLDNLISLVDSNFETILPDKDITKVLYVIEVLNPSFITYYAVDNLTDAQAAAIELIKN